jgi:hemerythrin-like metal-binding protein
MTQLIVWKDEYGVGNEELDQHHRTMFTIINDLYAGMIGGAANRDLTLLYKKALEYAQFHFDREERVLKDSKYPQLPEQQRAHQAYVRQIEALTKSIPTGQKGISMDMLHFLKNWWLNHILKLDRAYAPFIAAKNG